MKKIAVVVASLSAIMACMMTSCAKKQKTAKHSLTIVKGADGHSLNPMMELGKKYYGEYDLEVTVLPVERETIFESESVGKVDGAYNDLAAPLNFGGKGGNIVIYAGAMNGGMALLANPKVASENPDITNPANWKGLTITVQPLSIGEVITKSVLQNKYGFDLEKDITYKIIAGQPEELSATQKGNADIVIIGPDFVETAKNMGLVYLFPLVALENDYVCCRQTASAAKFSEDREAYVSLLKAHIRAYKDYKSENKNEQVAVMAKSSGIDEEWIYDFLYDTDKTQGRSHNPDPNFNGSVAVYKTLGHDRPLEDFFDIDVYADALQAILQQFPDDSFYKDMWTFFIEHNDQYPGFTYQKNL